MAACWHLAGAVILLLIYVTGYSNAAMLEVLPSGDVQSKPIGSSIILTCKPDVDDPKLITNMEWLDPQNRVIESLKLTSGNSKPLMYTEKRPGNNLALLFNNLQEQQAGKYTCKATYANTDHLSKTVVIDTIVAITWDDAPENQYPILGEDFKIKCNVRARPSPTVDWLRNGDLIVTNDDHYVIETHALKIKKVTEEDDGIYTCRASVATTGELKERNIRVEVHIKPEIQELESTIDVIEGETANINCIAKGKPPPKFTWVKSITHQDLSKADRFSVNEDTGVMNIRNVNRDDDGEYQCTAANAAGTANMNIRINVIVKPKIMEFVNKTIPVGKDVELMCKAFGRPPPTIMFRKHTSDRSFVIGTQPKDDRITLENRHDDVTGQTVGVLKIMNVLRSDDGLYECIGQNKGGTTYKTGHLTVEFPPTFEATENRTHFAWENHPGNMTCIATSMPNATIEWMFYGGQRIQSNPQLEIHGKGPKSTLIVHPLDNRFFITYKCVASNRYGTSEHSFVLKEGRKPGSLIQAKLLDITATTALFDLQVPVAENDLPIRTISVQYKEERETWNYAKNRTWAVNSTYILEGLKPQTNYYFRFAAANEVGYANWDNQITEATLPKSRPATPKILSRIMPGMEYELSPFSNQYEVKWLLPADNGEEITHFQITYCQLKRISGEWEEQPSTCLVEEERGQRTILWLKQLNSDTFYKIEVRAKNYFGYSEPGVIRIKTNRESSGVTVDYSIVSAGDTSKLAVVTAFATALTILSLAI